MDWIRVLVGCFGAWLFVTGVEVELGIELPWWAYIGLGLVIGTLVPR